MKQYKKIVLAYSGGLDTSVIIPWLKGALRGLRSHRRGCGRGAGHGAGGP